MKNKAVKKALTVFGIIAILTLVTNTTSLFESKAQEADTGNSKEIVKDTTASEEQDISMDEIEEKSLSGIRKFLSYTGFNNATPGHLVMLLVGLFFIFLAIKYDYEPLLLVPIGTGIIMGNIPFFQADGINLQLGI